MVTECGVASLATPILGNGRIAKQMVMASTSGRTETATRAAG